MAYLPQGVGKPGVPGVSTFITLTDCPNSYAGQAGNFINVNAGQSGLQFITPGTIASIIGPLISFLQLSDTPNAYTNTAGQYVKVNSAENALIFSYFPIRSVAGDAVLTVNDFTVLIDAGGADSTATLPDASTVSGIVYNIKKIDGTGNIVTITPFGGQTVDDDVNRKLTVHYESITIQSNGANWFII